VTRVALVVAYDGTDFAGWQAQAEERTVQRELERAASVLAGGAVVVEGAGRTDAGVHAEGQVAHVDVPEAAAVPLGWRMNPLLPADLRVRGSVVVDETFHARKSAVWKRYRYRLRLAPVDDPLARRVRWHVAWRVDVDAVRAAAPTFVGERDFAALQSAGSSVATSVRAVTRCEVVGEPPEVDVVVEGSGFLRHMVRALVGCLLEVGRGRRPPEWIEDVLAGRRREEAGPNAPAHGLVLEAVGYPPPWDEALAAAVASPDRGETA